MTATQRLPRSVPEAQGIPSSAILAFVEAADRTIRDLHSLMLVRHGQVVAEGWWAPYRADRRHMLFSLSKSFTSSAIGFAVAEGLLSVDDPVLPFFPDAAPATVSDNLAAMRVRDLLTMTTGHAEDTLGPMFEAADGDWARAFLAISVAHAPGTHFVYNSGATYMLSAILQRRAGMTLLEYLQPRLLAPLGIVGATWEMCPRGVNTGGWGLTATTEDIACFGQLYLQCGAWEGRQLLPAGWAEEATSRQVPNDSQSNPDWKQGYGYQFWRARHGAYRGDGAFGQFCLVMPDQEAVLAITAGVKDMQSVLDLVWEHLLPAMGPDPAPADDAARERLGRRLAGLALQPAQGRPDSPTAARVGSRTYHFEANERGVETMAFAFDGDGCVVTIGDGQGEHRLSAGFGAWREGTTAFDLPEPRPVAASGAWADAETYVMKLCLVETPFCPTVTFRFVGDEVAVDVLENVSFGPPERPRLTGRLA